MNRDACIVFSATERPRDAEEFTSDQLQDTHLAAAREHRPETSGDGSFPKDSTEPREKVASNT